MNRWDEHDPPQAAPQVFRDTCAPTSTRCVLHPSLGARAPRIPTVLACRLRAGAELSTGRPSPRSCPACSFACGTRRRQPKVHRSRHRRRIPLVSHWSWMPVPLAQRHAPCWATNRTSRKRPCKPEQYLPDQADLNGDLYGPPTANSPCTAYLANAARPPGSILPS